MAHVAGVSTTEMNESSYKDVVMKEYERSAPEAALAGRDLNIGGAMSEFILGLKRLRGVAQDDLGDMTQ